MNALEEIPNRTIFTKKVAELRDYLESAKRRNISAKERQGRSLRLTKLWRECKGKRVSLRTIRSPQLAISKQNSNQVSRLDSINVLLFLLRKTLYEKRHFNTCCYQL